MGFSRQEYWSGVPSPKRLLPFSVCPESLVALCTRTDLHSYYVPGTVLGILYVSTHCCCASHSVVSNSVQPHRRQPTRLPRPRDSPGKNAGRGCHFLLQCMKVKSESEVAQSCLTPSDPVDCSLPCSSVHGIFQARVLEWAATAFSISLN